MRIGLRHVPRTSWVMARGYSWNLFTAVLALPMALLMVLVYAIRGGAYLSEDRTGMVFFCRNRPLLDMLLSLLLMLLAIVGLVILGIYGRPYAELVPGAVIALPFLWVVVAGIVFTASGGVVLSVTGPETPKGQRWAVAGLAQLPGTSMSGLVLARRLVDEAPRGAVVVAAAASDAHLRTYEALGFTVGQMRRVYRVMPA